MMPKVVVYNSVSIDTSINGYAFDVGLHYEVAEKLNADAFLVGSETAKAGIKLFNQTIPTETPSDYNKSFLEDNEAKPLWVIADSQGKLNGLLHVLRRSTYCKDVTIIVTTKTPKNYLSYLKERNYGFIKAGKEKINYPTALKKLSKQHQVKTVVTDSGGVLISILFKHGLVDQLSLLIAPVIVGKQSMNLFRTLDASVNLVLISHEQLRNNNLLVNYNVKRNNRRKTSQAFL
jgi:2,5-diamino-6-(ribosylamino)-4(3H)-pyrimidinone 5'-phosphate reductase